MIMRPWLIQRGVFKDVTLDEVRGIDSLIAWDYMGAAEFEFGSLVASMKRIVRGLDDYTISPTTRTQGGQRLMLFARAADILGVESLVKQLSVGKLRLREGSRLNEALAGKQNDGWPTPNFWIDIDHDWMMWLGENRSRLVLRALQCLKERGFGGTK